MKTEIQKTELYQQFKKALGINDMRTDDNPYIVECCKIAEDYAKLRLSAVRFQLPSDKQMIDIAILFNDGKLEQQKLADMVAYAQFIVDRLYENGDVGIPSSKEEGN